MSAIALPKSGSASKSCRFSIGQSLLSLRVNFHHSNTGPNGLLSRIRKRIRDLALDSDYQSSPLELGNLSN